MPSALFTPMSLRGVTFANRAWVSPMCMYSAVDGLANEWHRVHYGALATGGAGLLMIESVSVTGDGRIAPDDLGLWNDDQAASLQPIVDFAHAQGMPIGIQLAHAGRKASTYAPGKGSGPVPPEAGGWATVAPSAKPYGAESIPRALTVEHLGRITAATGEAADRAARLGFDVVEVQAGHGYLLHEFTSPLTNLRDDEYGGSFDNRTRIVRETVDVVRASWPDDRPVFVRVSSTDWVDGGWTVDDTVALSRQLADQGVDLIDCSSGGLEPGEIEDPYPAHEVDFAARVRREAGLPSSAVGFITEPAQAELLVASGQADAVMLGRVMLREPRWPLRAATELGERVPWPLPYDRARPERAVPQPAPGS